MKKRFVKLTALILASSMLLAGCGSSESTKTETVDLNSMSVEEITAGISLPRLQRPSSEKFR